MTARSIFIRTLITIAAFVLIGLAFGQAHSGGEQRNLAMDLAQNLAFFVLGFWQNRPAAPR